MLVKRFTKELENGQVQDSWVTERKDGQGEIVSVALHCTEETFNPQTGFIQVEKFMYWIKGATLELVERNLKVILEQINKGVFVPFRVFSTEPMYDGQQPDVNPSTQEPMDRYSQVRLGSKKQALELHRTYVEIPVDATARTEDKAPVQEKVTTNP